MAKTYKVIYENGVFRPLEEIKLQEHQKFSIVILDEVSKEDIEDETNPKSSRTDLFGSWSWMTDEQEEEIMDVFNTSFAVSHKIRYNHVKTE